MVVSNGDGAGCEVHALKRTRDREHERKSAFMRAIIAEAAGRVKRTPLFDMPLSVCYTDKISWGEAFANKLLRFGLSATDNASINQDQLRMSRPYHTR